MVEIVSDGAAVHYKVKTLSEQIDEVTSEMKITSNALWQHDMETETKNMTLEAGTLQTRSNRNEYTRAS